MKTFYALMTVLVLLVSACAQGNNESQPSNNGMPAYGSIGDGKNTDTKVNEDENNTGADDKENESPKTNSNEVRMLGVGKYEPLETSISRGSTITFFNDGKLKTVITIKGKGKTINTPVIQPGEKYEQEFTEIGRYEYWGVAYGSGGAMIIVE